jgi:hypothetical protein
MLEFNNNWKGIKIEGLKVAGKGSKSQIIKVAKGLKKVTNKCKWKPKKITVKLEDIDLRFGNEDKNKYLKIGNNYYNKYFIYECIADSINKNLVTQHHKVYKKQVGNEYELQVYYPNEFAPFVMTVNKKDYYIISPIDASGMDW